MRSSNTAGDWPLTRTQNGSASAGCEHRIGCPRSSIFCARRPPMISRFTSRARCSAGSSGAWRWRRSRPMTWIGISKFCAATQASSTCLPRTCSSMSPASSAIRRCSISWRRRSFPTWSAARRPITRSASGSPGAAPGEETYSLAMLFREADRGGEAQHQAAGLRLRCRSGCRRQRPRGPLPGNDRGGRVAGAARPLLLEGRSRLPGIARAARGGGLHGTGCAGRSAVLAPRPRFVPQSSDLSAPRGAGEGRLAVPFRAARGRHSASWQLGDGRQSSTAASRSISKPERLYRHIGRSRPGELRLFDERRRRRASPRAAGTRPGALAPSRSRRALPTAGDGDLCAGGGPDQPQA